MDEIYQPGSAPAGKPGPGGNAAPGGGWMPGMGSTVTDPHAPKTIQSEEMVFFEVSSRFEGLYPAPEYTYVYGYAARVDEGALAALIYQEGGAAQAGTFTAVALVDDGILEALQQIVRKYDFIRKNGYSHFVNGLPGSFGGSMDVEYVSGEYIHADDNQSLIMDPEAGAEIVGVLKQAIAETGVSHLDCGQIMSVRYREDRKDGCYTDLCLTQTLLTSEGKYGPGEAMCYRQEKQVPPEVLVPLRQKAENGVLLHWGGLPESAGTPFTDAEQQIIFTLQDGTRRSIHDRMRGPGPAKNSVFEIRSYLMNIE